MTEGPTRRWPWLAALALTLMLQALVGCSGGPGTGPVAMKLDRYPCERCRMMVSDPEHAVQIRVKESGGRSKVHFFDDIGCAVVWLENKPFRDAPDTEIWVADWRNGHWIDARKAHYVTGQITPMQYGLGAQPDPGPKTLSFEQAKAHIFQVERDMNGHGADHEGEAQR